MGSVNAAAERLLDLVPFLLTLLAVAGVLAAADRMLARRSSRDAESDFRNKLVMLGLSLAGLIALLVAAPLRESIRGQLLGFLGIVLSAAVALSATTILGNALAGLMLRAIGGFRVGDFVKVDDQFGRVSERGLFHTEIQTEERDLVTLPNLLLASRPVRVIRASGTIITANVSLGYDIPRQRVERALLRAAGETGLGDPFVQVRELGDDAVTYRVGGLLEEIRHVISDRSRLRAAVMDALHADGIEIVSPRFMNTRAIPPDRRFIPPAVPAAEPAPAAAPEDVAFDKAEEAASLESLRERLQQARDELAATDQQIKEATDETARDAARQRRERLAEFIAHLERVVAERERQQSDGSD